MNLLEQTQLAAILLLTPSILYYIWGKKIVFEKKDESVLLTDLRSKLKNYTRTKESLAFYQKQYHDLKIYKLKYKAIVRDNKELEQRVSNFVKTLEVKSGNEYGQTGTH